MGAGSSCTTCGSPRTGRLDAWLAEGTASLSIWLLSLGGFETLAAGRTFGLADAPGLRVVDGCNGLSVLGLFAGFVLAYPGSVVRRMLFIPLGVLVIYGVNVGRLVTLAAVQETFSLGQVGTQLRALYEQALASCG